MRLSSRGDTVASSSPAHPPSQLDLHRRLAVLAIGALHLLRSRGLLARLILNHALDLLHRALDLVLERWLSLVVGVWGALLGHAGLGRERSLGLLGACDRGLAFACRLGGDGSEDSGFGVAGCAASLGHCFWVGMCVWGSW
jgi:hypothetical protein